MPQFLHHRNESRTARTCAFTLVELLVVIAIVGLLVSLLLAAVSQSREAGRRIQCVNHLRQIGLAAQSHLAAVGHFPSGGWGLRWHGDPERGFAEAQPGSWAYNLLPYLEQQPLHALGGGDSEANKMRAAAQRIATPLTLFHCPSRRGVRPYLVVAPYAQVNAPPVEKVARTDYATNAGTFAANELADGGPLSLQEGDSSYRWPRSDLFTGVSFVRSHIRMKDIVDGTTKTYFGGEKYQNPETYELGPDPGDRADVYAGFFSQSVRIASRLYVPVRDRWGRSSTRLFGAPHPSVCNFAFCDGSVRGVAYDVGADVHDRQSNRRDHG